MGYAISRRQENQTYLLRALLWSFWQKICKKIIILKVYKQNGCYISFFTKADVMEIAGFIEVLHNSSLIIDDIEDNR